MKKEYIAPQADFLEITLLDDILVHSPFETGGRNLRWDWNDEEDAMPSDLELDW